VTRLRTEMRFEVVFGACSLPLSMGGVEVEVTCKSSSEGTRSFGSKKVLNMGRTKKSKAVFCGS
jgi:hypothetical protein